MIKTFAVNLASQNEKKESILNECARHNIPVEIIEAVNGKALSEQKIHQLVDNYPACSLTPGEIGCALSHIKIYQRMVDEKIPLALVLEDDAMLSNDIKDVLDAIQTLEVNQEQAQIYLLSPSNYYLDSFKKPLTQLHTLNKVIDAYYTHAYIVNLAAAKTLLAFLQPVRYEADRWGYFQQMGVVQISCVVPPPALTNDDDKTGSAIEQERLQAQKNRSIYYRKLRKKEMPLGKKLQRLFWKLVVMLHLVKVIRKKV